MTSSATSGQKRSRLIGISQGVDHGSFSYDRSLADHLGLALREKEVCWMVKSRLKRLGALVVGEVPHSFSMARDIVSDDRFQEVISEIDRRLEAMAMRPLMPLMVEQVLGITAHERLRWTKDGRLPRSGQAAFRKAGAVVIATHPVDKISRLQAQPDVIAAWREARRQEKRNKGPQPNSKADRFLRLASMAWTDG
jgi:hypothetical protein